MDLSEILDEIREIEIYDVDPKDWMGYMKECPEGRTEHHLS